METKKFIPEQSTKTQMGSRVIALLFPEPLPWMGVGGQRHAPAALRPGKTRYPLHRRLGESHTRSGRVRKNLAPNRDSIPRPSNP